MLAPLSSTEERVIDSPSKSVPKLSSLNLYPIMPPPPDNRLLSHRNPQLRGRRHRSPTGPPLAIGGTRAKRDSQA